MFPKKDSQIKTLRTNLNEKDAQVDKFLSVIEKKELHMRVLAECSNEMIKDELATQRNRLEDLAKGKEQEVKALHKKLDSLNEMYVQSIKQKNAAGTAINSLLGEVTERYTN